jgi:hypothetical protein
MVREMATGAVFMTVFGLIWVVWGIRLLRLPVRLSLALYIAAMVIAASLFAVEIPRLYQPSTAAEQIHWHDLRSRFVLINVLQYTGIAVAVGVCLRLRRRDLLPPALSLIVGVHFIPLAGLFGFPPFYAVAAAITLLDLGAMLLLTSPAREATCALGTGCVVWLSSLFVLLRSAFQV